MNTSIKLVPVKSFVHIILTAVRDILEKRFSLKIFLPASFIGKSLFFDLLTQSKVCNDLGVIVWME